MIPVCVPWLPGDEKKYVIDAIESNWISSSGKYIEKFEDSFSRFIGTKYGVTCSSCSTALHLACSALELKKGDEVIVTTLTNIASVNGIIQSGATPVLVDIEADTWNIDASEIREKITNKTKAIMAVHIYGHPCDMDPIIKLAKEHNLYIIEDVAEAHGAEYKGRKCGSFSEIACFSFYANKVLTTGEGGMCLTNNERLAEKIKFLRNMAFGPPESRFVHHEIGFNYRLTNIQAAIGLAQTENADKLVEARRNVGLKYNKLLKSIPELILPVEKDYAKNIYWMYCVILSDKVPLSKEQVMGRLKEKGIETRSLFVPMHQQPAYLNKKIENAPDCNGEFPIADKVSKRGFYLPSSSNLSDKEIEYTVETLKEIISGG